MTFRGYMAWMGLTYVGVVTLATTSGVLPMAISALLVQFAPAIAYTLR